MQLQQLRVTEDAVVIPAGLSWNRVVWSETGYTTGGKQGVLSGAGNSAGGPVSVKMPAGWRAMRSEPAGTNKGHQLVWLDRVKTDGRMLEFWVSPANLSRHVGEVWLSYSPGGSFWQQQGYRLKMGSSSEGFRAYVVE